MSLMNHVEVLCQAWESRLQQVVARLAAISSSTSYRALCAGVQSGFLQGKTRSGIIALEEDLKQLLNEFALFSDLMERVRAVRQRKPGLVQSFTQRKSREEELLELLDAPSLVIPSQCFISLSEPEPPAVRVRAEQFWRDLSTHLGAVEQKIKDLENAQLRLDQDYERLGTRLKRLRGKLAGQMGLNPTPNQLDAWEQLLKERLPVWGRDPMEESCWQELAALTQELTNWETSVTQSLEAGERVEKTLASGAQTLEELLARWDEAFREPSLAAGALPGREVGEKLKEWLEKLRDSAAKGFSVMNLDKALVQWSARLKEFGEAIEKVRDQLAKNKRELNECLGLYESLKAKAERTGAANRPQVQEVLGGLSRTIRRKPVEINVVRALLKRLVEVLC